jgi:hypothetical protein
MRRKNGALLLAKMAKNGAFQKKFERNKSAINGTFETKNRLPQSDAATRPDSHVLAPYQTWFPTICLISEGKTTKKINPAVPT